MKFAKTRNVKSPCRGTSKSSGIDFYIPQFSSDVVASMINPLLEENKDIQDLITLNRRFIKRIDETGFVVESLGRVFIPSGIKVSVPEGYDLVAHNKGGIATKKGLLYGAHVIDEDYTGEIFLSIFNVSPDPVLIEWDKKILQLILREVYYDDVEEISLENLNLIYSERKSIRGSGCLGSTGIK